MIQKATLLQSIQNAFTAIEENENNPLRLNYYIMKEVVKDVNIPFGDELKTLIFKAEALLKDYNEKFGVDLCDPIIFSTWYNIYYNLDIDKIKNSTLTLVNEITDNFEKSAVKAADELAKIGANVIMFSTNKQLLHHASSEDLMLMIKLLNPKFYIPVKGEYRYMVGNANLASSLGIANENILLKQKEIG
jgi:hypothetical protein